MRRRWLTWMLVLCIVLSLSGCMPSAANLMAQVQPQEVQAQADLSSYATATTDFSVRLLQYSAGTDQNILLSPLSIQIALAMVANGAKGETYAQMENVLGLPVQTLNTSIHTYMAGLSEKGDMCHLANAIWLRDDPRLTVIPDFLQANADYYGAGAFKAPFDNKTCKQINQFIEDNTGGLIRNVLDSIPPHAVMYLVNALSFEAEWQSVYEKHQVRSGIFTTEDGTQREVDMMYSMEYLYLENESSTGFMKHYDGGAYAFVALLPNQDVCLWDYVASMTGEALQQMLSGAQSLPVHAGTPKFECTYGTDLCAVLADMGMPDAFDLYKADLTGLARSDEGNIYISRVLHKTYITMCENGTKAGAVTVVEPGDSAGIEEEKPEPKEVILDRPFVYMLIDCENNLPIFIGTMLDVEN